MHRFLPIVLPTAAGQPSPAAAKCNPGRPDRGNEFYQAGWRRTPGTTVGGIYSNILNYSPWVYPTGRPWPHTSGWAMIQQSSGANWAQVGWMEEPWDPNHQLYAKRYVFVQWTVNGSWNTPILFDQPAGDVGVLWEYKVLYNNTPGKFTFFYKGTQLPVDANAGWVPNQGKTAGEIKTLGSQMPGGTNYGDMWMAGSNIWYSGSWRPFSASYFEIEPGSPYPNQWGGTALAPPYDYGIHDNRC